MTREQSISSMEALARRAGRAEGIAINLLHELVDQALGKGTPEGLNYAIAKACAEGWDLGEYLQRKVDTWSAGLCDPARAA